MNGETGKPIQWRVHLRASPAEAYAAISTADGRARFWADAADEVEPGIVEFRFRSGERWRSRILVRDAPREFSLTYIADSCATFTLEPYPGGGTVLTLTETGTPAGEWLENYAGWVSLLLNLKAALDFGVDLRNRDPARSWAKGFVDV